VSQLQVIPWYQKLGFKPEGELFDEDGGRCTHDPCASADRLPQPRIRRWYAK
jgi:hypothetical protein